jgi:hypothetical protein
MPVFGLAAAAGHLPTAQKANTVRAENPVHGSDQQGCAPSHPAVMIIDHVPAVRVSPDRAGRRVAAVVPA